MKHGRQFRGSEMNVKRHQNQHFIRTNKQQRTTFLSGEWKRPIHEKKRNNFGGPAQRRGRRLPLSNVWKSNQTSISPRLCSQPTQNTPTLRIASCGSTVKSSSIVPATSGSPVIRANGP